MNAAVENPAAGRHLCRNVRSEAIGLNAIVTQQMKSRLMFAATLFMLLAVAAIMSANEANIFRNDGRLLISRDTSDPRTVTLTWRSEVETPMARRFEEAFAAEGPRAERFIIDLNSPGGAIAEGEQVIRLISRMKRTHQIDTRIGGRRKCFSMCVPIFLQGENRIAEDDSLFMFHEPTSVDYFTGEEAKTPAFEKARVTKRFVERYFVGSPMDAKWRNELVAGWQGKDIFKDGRQLVDEQTNIITDLQ